VGVDLARFTPAATLAPATHVLCVAAYRPYKGWSDLLAAVARLRQGGHDLRLCGIGEGDPAWVLALAQKLGLGHAVRLWPPRPHADMPALYRQHGLLVAPSWREGFGLAPLEAMACGVPVVCSGQGGMCDWLVPGENALVAPPHDPSALARVMAQAVGDDGLRARLRQRGLDTSARFGLAGLSVGLAEFYRALT
jgi:glycosyltransferase involved in cell wall biosynthesis